MGSPEGTNVQYDNFSVSSPEIAFSYYASWGISQGGIPSIMGDGPLQGAVDLSLFVLQKTDLLFDNSSWNGLAPVLDRYKFGGFVNDLDVSARLDPE